jgi:hypothetical protein
MALQIRLSQPLAGPVGQSRHAVGTHAEQGRDVGRLLPLDLEVPKHHLPTLGQRRECPCCGAVLELGHGGIRERNAWVELLDLVAW